MCGQYQPRGTNKIDTYHGGPQSSSGVDNLRELVKLIDSLKDVETR